MKGKLKSIILPFFLLASLAGCGGNSGPTYTKVESDTLYVRKVENLANDFIMGMDASSVIAEEESGVKYYNFEGEEEDVFKILHDNGINYIRVRIWNDPYDANGNGYGGGNNDVAKAIEIGKRATKYGMKLLANFHYSDFWADPAKQMVPKAWKDLDYYGKYEAIHDFTKDTLQELKNNGADVGMVQIGNETNGGKMAGESTRFDFFVGLYNSAAEAVKEVYPYALRAIHFANPEKSANYLDWAEKLNKYECDYDVFGSSYYPYWHGTLDNLSSVLSTIAQTYHKKTMVLETSYCFEGDNAENSDGWSNTISSTSDVYKPYPFSIAGQTNSVRDIIDTIANHTTNGIGVCYWEGTWIAVGPESDWEGNQAKWEQYGSGWASSYAAEYDPKDAGKYYGGCAVENQAFFNAKGQPLESLKVWNLVRFGNDAPLYVDGVEDVMVTFGTDDDIKLPETVNVLYNDMSKKAVPVTWEPFDTAAAKAAGNADYVIKGTIAGGVEVKCFLSVREKNFVKNDSFEDEDMSMWSVTNNSATDFNPDYYKAVVTGENVKTGTKAFAFWAQSANTLNFNLEQTLDIKNLGTYKCQASFTGGVGSGAAAADKQNIYLYVKINGIEVYKADVKISSWNNWHTAKLDEVEVDIGDEVVIGVHVECSQADVWGSVDDVMFNFVK